MDSHEQTWMLLKVTTPNPISSSIPDMIQVRTTRSRIIHLKNDYKGLMNVIEKHIHEHFARQAANAASEDPLPINAMDVDMVLPSRPPPVVFTPPFAKVNSVVEGSPAETAGLKAGDQIRNFGYVNNTNHDGLKKVGECVQGNEGVFSFLELYGIC